MFLPGLGRGDLYRTEGLRALIARGCLEGHWLVPTLYGEPALTKPPGLYVAIALASWPGGRVTEFTARLPSVLAATAVVFLVYFHARRAVGPRGGLATALLVPVSLMWLDKMPSAEIDALQVFWVTAAILCFLRALEGEEADARSPNSLWWFAALLCVAGGFLTKWTAPAFFYLTVVPLLLWRGRFRWLFGRQHLLAVAVACGVCLAWVLAVVVQVGWPPLAEAVGREAWVHLAPQPQRRPHPWRESLAHPFILLGAALPGVLFALPARHRRFLRDCDEPARRWAQALHCWAWPNVLFWSLASEHSPRHSFPLFPALAGLAGLGWLAWSTGRAASFAGLSTLQSFFPASPPALGRRGDGGEGDSGPARGVGTSPVASSSPSPPSPLPRSGGEGTKKPSRWAGRVLVAVLVAWLVAKTGYELAAADRHSSRQTREKARQLAEAVPPAACLHLGQFKDDGLMFYYGRPVRRVSDVNCLPFTSELVYAVCTEAEWAGLSGRDRAQPLGRFRDQQGDPFVLVRSLPAQLPAAEGRP